MLKTILIITVLILLVATASKLTSVAAQAPQNPNAADKEESDSKSPVSDDYHRSVNERFVINTIKKLYEAEAEYSSRYGGGTYGRLQYLGQARLIDSVLASGQKYGYYFSISVQPMDAYGGNFTVSATPTHYMRTGKRSFVMDTACRIHGDDKAGYEANFEDPVVDSCLPFLAIQFEYDLSFVFRQILPAQAEYYKSYGNGNYGTLNNLVVAGLIDPNLSATWGNRMSIEVFLPTKTEPARFILRGSPWYRRNGMRSFYADESGILRAADLGGMPADENTPELVFENEDLIKFAMRSLWKAQMTHAGYGHLGNGYYATNFDELERLGLTGFNFENGTYGGYRFELVVDNNHKHYIFRNFEVRATPLDYSKDTARSFFISRHFMLRGSDKYGQPADENDPIVEF